MACRSRNPPVYATLTEKAKPQPESEVSSGVHRSLGAEKARVLRPALPSSCTDPNLGVAAGTLRG